jgi:hypothetical protein
MALGLTIPSVQEFAELISLSNDARRERFHLPPSLERYLLTVACPCGVVFERWVTPEDAELDLLRAASLN